MRISNKFCGSVLLLDVGERYIKAVAYRCIVGDNFEFVGADRCLSAGIKNGLIFNSQILLSAICELIRRIELAYGFTAEGVIASISFLDLNVEYNECSIAIDKIVKKSHIKEISRISENVFSSLSGVFSLDNLKNIQNPEGMIGSLLTYEEFSIRRNESFLVNFIWILKKLNLDILAIEHGTAVLSKNIEESEFCLLDIGYSFSRILISIENKYYGFFLNIGSSHLLKKISEDLGESLENVESKVSTIFTNNSAEIVNITQEFLFNLFSKIFATSKNIPQFNRRDIPIFLFGALPFIPGVEFFLEKSFSRDFRLPNMPEINGTCNEYAFLLAKNLCFFTSKWKFEPQELWSLA